MLLAPINRNVNCVDIFKPTLRFIPTRDCTCDRQNKQPVPHEVQGIRTSIEGVIVAGNYRGEKGIHNRYPLLPEKGLMFSPYER